MAIKVAVIGNPNVGKSVIFNNLTGGRAHVGNWPGKTVEKKTGGCTYKGVDIEVIDLPGTYSLTARSVDELVARTFIVEEKPDVVVDIVDASNLERNLYLTTQLMELEANIVIALNKCDLADEVGYEIDFEELSTLLAIPVVPTVATTKKGMDELKDAIIEAAKRQRKMIKMSYGRELDDLISKVEKAILKDEKLSSKYPSRWLAIKVLENDEEVLKKVEGSSHRDEILEMSKAREILGEEPEVVLAERRYNFISKILPKVLKGEKAMTLSDLLDKALLNRALGIPVFLALWWALFRFTFDVSGPLSDLIGMSFSRLGEIVRGAIAHEQLASFIADGVIGGLGSVLVFLPPIFFLFIGLSLLEDSGYLARAAFVVDRVMYKLGLHGKSFIPMLIGFGCNIPGVMAARTVDKEEDRILTILVNPLMSCSARLPVYILIGGAVLGAYAAAGTYSMYILGIVLAVLMALLFRRVIPYFKGKPSPFVLELPMYSRPTLRATLTHMWERGSVFLKKAGTIIFLGIIVVWVLSAYPWEAVHVGEKTIIEGSYLGMLGHALEPIFRPLGFNWMGAVALFFGFIAKEIVVGSFGVIFGLGAEAGTQEIQTTLREQKIFTPVTGLAFMAFTLIYIPCVATVGIIYRETNSWKWTIFTVVYEIVLAYIVSLAIVGIGGLLGYA